MREQILRIAESLSDADSLSVVKKAIESLLELVDGQEFGEVHTKQFTNEFFGLVRYDYDHEARHWLSDNPHLQILSISSSVMPAEMPSSSLLIYRTVIYFRGTESPRKIS